MDAITEHTLKKLNLSRRQLQFFAVNCCEQILNSVTPEFRIGLSRSESFIDGFGDRSMIESFKTSARLYYNHSSFEWVRAVYCVFGSVLAKDTYFIPEFSRYDESVCYYTDGAIFFCRDVSLHNKIFMDFQHTILNDLIKPLNLIFTNNPDVQSLADEIYQDKNWNLISILRDALIDYKFDDRFIEHLNEPYHRRGCWVLEVLKSY